MTTTSYRLDSPLPLGGAGGEGETPRIPTNDSPSPRARGEGAGG
jgi:hypothetical protein